MRLVELCLIFNASAVSIATRAVSIFSDGVVVVLTWVKTYRVFVLTRKVSFRTNYSALILRDGEFTPQHNHATVLTRWLQARYTSCESPVPR